MHARVSKSRHIRKYAKIKNRAYTRSKCAVVIENSQSNCQTCTKGEHTPTHFPTPTPKPRKQPCSRKSSIQLQINYHNEHTKDLSIAQLDGHYLRGNRTARRRSINANNSALIIFRIKSHRERTATK